MGQRIDTRPYTSSTLRGHGGLKFEEASIEPETDDESVIFCHGWRNYASEPAEQNFQVVEEALKAEGFDGCFVSWRWKSGLPWRNAIKSAEKEGYRLADYAEKFYDQNDAELHIIGYSLGAKAVMEAQKELAEKDKSFNSIHLMAGAVKSSDFSDTGLYHTCLKNSQIFNYRSPRDLTLRLLFPLSEALGKQGLETRMEQVNDCKIGFRCSRRDVHGSYIEKGSRPLSEIAEYLTRD